MTSLSTPDSVPAPSNGKQHHLKTNGPTVLARQRTQSPSSSTNSLPYRSKTKFANLYASTSLPGTVRNSGSSTPNPESGFAGSTVHSGIDGQSGTGAGAGQGGRPDIQNLIQRAFAPHVSVVASPDTDALLRDRGFKGGFLSIIRPYGERVSGKVTVRDSIGASRTYDDFGIRFVGLGNQQPKRWLLARAKRSSLESRANQGSGSITSSPSRNPLESCRVAGHIRQVEDVTERHLSFAELRPPLGHQDDNDEDSQPELGDVHAHASADAGGDVSQCQTRLQHQPAVPCTSPFYSLYLSRLLSGLPLTPHETFSHPVACIIAASSRSPSPIEEFKRLYHSTNTGDDRLPQWVNNEYLRYYILVHDEDNDEISKSTALYEQMKRNFGLHCHLLRLRSSQCVPTDDDSVRLPGLEWMTAAEELMAMEDRELSEDDDDPTPCLFESDAGAIRSFVRELVTQSIIPNMERLCAQWNETIATKRKGLSGRILSASKRWGFGLGRSSNLPSAISSSSSSYDSLQGFYRPDTAEALMRKLADYAFMLRDLKLAHQTYDVLRSDFENDKAWKYYAGANEMYLVSTMLNVGQPINKRLESIERWLEGAVHSYVHRCNDPCYALRALLLAFESVKARGSLTVDDAASWASRILEINLAGPNGSVLIMERIASCYAQRRLNQGMQHATRCRKQGVWALLAAESWSTLGKTVQAERCLGEAMACFNTTPKQNQHPPALNWMLACFQQIREVILATRLERLGPDASTSPYLPQHDTVVEEISEKLDGQAHRKSVIVDTSDLTFSSALNPGPTLPGRTSDLAPRAADDGFV